jgi:hypothetical protein
MKNLLRLSIAIFLIANAGVSEATTYYVSHNGDDANNGTSTGTPWRSIARVQQHMNNLLPGDQVLFERGGIYPGKLDIWKSGTSAQPLVFGAYGTGDDPIISGGEFVNNWVPYAGNIWRAEFTGSPKYLIVNNQPMTLARYPNHEWLRNTQGTNSQINASGLGQGGNYWDGAYVVVRTTNWSYERSEISSSSSGQINFTPIYVNLSNNDWGFYIEGKLAELDMPGEWFHDATTNQLYFWAPNDQDPNDLTVLASIHDKGLVPSWQKSHIRIENLTVQGQTFRGISTEDANNIVVTNCTIRYNYLGIASSGDSNQYINNTITHTFGTGVNVWDTNTLVENNIFSDVAIYTGMGENYWGYMGLNVTGSGSIVRRNRLNNIGYSGITVNNNVLVEKNVVTNACTILNDGAGITFDSNDGAVIQDNIVMDCFGTLESVATNHYAYYPICFGIYFGNTSIKNTIVQRNTVARCNGAGLHVDHTMVSTGNQVKDNILFDNSVQLSISDYSNYNGPGATPPYYVPNYNTIYSGNILYSLKKDQLCMRQFHVNSTQWVDFGTYSNNKYYNPYDELSIQVTNFQSGTIKKYTLERWQTLFNEDAGSTRSPLRLSEYEVTDVLGSNQITNGTFDYNVNGWSGWPTQAQVTHNGSFLDNGSMRVLFDNNTSYDQFFLNQENLLDLQAGEYYRLQFSVQSNMQGVVKAEVKKQSQQPTPYAMFVRDIPFSSDRRDMSLIFQSDGTEPGRINFINHFSESTYYLDNIRLERVAVQPIDPYSRHILLINDQNSSASFPLDGCWSLIDGTMVSGEITIAAFSSVVLQREDESNCGMTTGLTEDLASETHSPVFYPNPSKSGEILFMQEAAKKHMNVMLMDVTGRTLQTATIPAGSTHFTTLESIPAGMYLLQIQEGSVIKDQRIVLER